MRINLTKTLVLILDRKHTVQSQTQWVTDNTAWQVQPIGITLGAWWIGIMRGQH